MTDWMMETLLWTAVLIAVVLLVRRPVARTFGPQIAYALWAIPALRLILPPIELPAWMRLIPDAAEPSAAPLSELPQNNLVSALQAPEARSQSATVAHPDGALGAATDRPLNHTQTSHPESSVFEIISPDLDTLFSVGVAVWLIGAAIFLAMRFSAYFQLRDELLEDGREVGRAGAIRLVETPGTKAPLAFGVIDKVIALPDGFMALPDRQSRDLALAHELQHHKGGDLLANVLVQPLFAIHWWNPLGRYGWLALRRDQEAACDARVMQTAERKEREVYANLIVSFAAGPNVAPSHALTAPMACPVLGEKSIVHRLRSLKMDNKNTKSRVAGKLMLGASVIALPMTASISYAASEAPQVPQVSDDVPEAVGAPSVPSALEAPVAPEAPVVALADEQIIVVDPDGEVSNIDTNGENVFIWKSEEGDKDSRVIVRNYDSAVRFFEGSEFPGSKRLSKEELEKLLERSENSRLRFKSRSNSVRFFDRSDLDAQGKLSEEQIEEILVEVREGLEEANEVLKDLPEIIEKAQAEADAAQALADRGRIDVERRVQVVSSCKGSSSEFVTETTNEDGVQVIRICQKGVMEQALKGLREARSSIKGSDMDKAARSRALREIDRVISRWENEAR